MSVRERAAWTSLFITTAVWAVYFWNLWPDLHDGALRAHTFGAFMLAVFLLVAAQVVIAVVLALTCGARADRPPDEREERIELRAASHGFGMINILLVAVSALWMVGASPLVMANGILAAMVLAEVIRSGSIILGYRRGA